MPLPSPYLCSDAGSFAEHTLLVRLPEIARRMVAENEYSPAVLARIDALLAEIPDQPVRELDDPPAPDLALWARNFAAWLGRAWHDLSFLAAEKYFYRRILAATGYFHPGPDYLKDPYQRQKDLGLRSSGVAVRQLVDRLAQWRDPQRPAVLAVQEAIESNLWGNRADLSIWPAGAEKTPANEQLHQAEEYLLANHLADAARHLASMSGKGKPVHILVDNAGFELVSDLALADLLLYTGFAGQVVLQLKAHPTFVSDALIKDVTATIQHLAAEEDRAVSAFGRRLAEHIAQQRLGLASDFFWNAPLAFWDMPPALRQTLGQAGLVISKGDANYRRLVGDLRWPAETSFGELLAYFPAPLLALRVAKSEVMVGLAPGQPAQLDRREAGWRTNGRWGLIQFRG